MQAALVLSDPERFFVPAHLGARGWLALRLDLPKAGWAEVAELMPEAYRMTALRKLLDGPAAASRPQRPMT
ncbi:MAG: hypothetical protein WEC75_10160 [Dehalococcoidia bacterium]